MQGREVQDSLNFIIRDWALIANVVITSAVFQGFFEISFHDIDFYGVVRKCRNFSLPGRRDSSVFYIFSLLKTVDITTYASE